MKYIPRQLEKVLGQARATFPAILVTGPRQSGKTTLLKRSIAERFVSLEEPDTRLWATEDPRDFLETNRTPLIIDEIQYVPGLLPYIKKRIDDNRKPGQWFFSGSQQFSLMKNISESLAGRIAITTLLPFSFSEQKESLFGKWEKWFEKIRSTGEALSESGDIGEVMLRGSFPENIVKRNVNLKLWYDSYVQTYLERDLKTLYEIGNLNIFHKFLTLLAARTAQILNYSSLANDLGISVPTVKKWISVLEASCIIYLLQPYSRNLGKRIIKSPKLYFLDTGLVAYLTGISDVQHLLRGPMAGALFESFVVSEFVKSFYNFGERPLQYYFNNKNIWEIDLLIERNLKIYPVEIKLSSTIIPGHLKNFEKLRQLKGDFSEKNYLITNQRNAFLRKNTYICYWGNL